MDRAPTDWQNPLIKKAVLDSPVVEVTPFIWQGRLMLLESWRFRYEGEVKNREYLCIRDVEARRIVGSGMEGYSLASALVWEGALHIFAARAERDADGRVSWNDVGLCVTHNLTDWSAPEVVLEQDEGEHLFNTSACRDGYRFVMALESNICTPFTIRFAESYDLVHWYRIPEAVYGIERYTACPAIRWVDGWYYMLYLEHLSPRWWFETWLTRSRNLIDWEDAPRNPVIAPDPTRGLHPDCPEEGTECNASDPDLVEWQGKTRVYFTGGNQHWGGRLQYAEFDGPMRAFFEGYYAG